jgi:hypothetical protein
MCPVFESGHILSEDLDRTQLNSPTPPGVICTFRDPDPLGGVLVFSAVTDPNSPDSLITSTPQASVHRRVDHEIWVNAAKTPGERAARDNIITRRVVCTNPGGICDYHGEPVHAQILTTKITKVTQVDQIPADLVGSYEHPVIPNVASTPTPSTPIIPTALFDIVSDTMVNNPDGSTTETIVYDSGMVRTITTSVTYVKAASIPATPVISNMNAVNHADGSQTITINSTTFEQTQGQYVELYTCNRYEFDKVGVDPTTGLDYEPVDTHGRIYGMDNSAQFGWSDNNV